MTFQLSYHKKITIFLSSSFCILEFYATRASEFSIVCPFSTDFREGLVSEIWGEIKILFYLRGVGVEASRLKLSTRVRWWLQLVADVKKFKKFIYDNITARLIILLNNCIILYFHWISWRIVLINAQCLYPTDIPSYLTNYITFWDPFQSKFSWYR